jgi:hypothetical protein
MKIHRLLSSLQNGLTERSSFALNPQFLWKCLCQFRVIAVFPIFRLLTDFVCVLTYEFCLSLWKIARCSVVLLLPLFMIIHTEDFHIWPDSGFPIFLSILSVPDEGYTRNAPCALNLISTFLFWEKGKNELYGFIYARSGAVKSYSTHHFFGNACTKSGPLWFSQFFGCWLILSGWIRFYGARPPASITVKRFRLSLLQHF